MARPKKIGIDYFPHDVDMHDNFNVRRLMHYHGGGNAYAVYLTILEFIYKAGYYISVDKFLIFNLAGILKYEEEYITSVIEACVENELFIENLFKNESILTSFGIQKRYIKIALLSNRKISANEPFLLDEIIDEFNLMSNKTQVMSNKTQVMSVENTQSKGKESKEKERKDIDSSLRSESQSSDEPMTVGDDERNSGGVGFDNREEGSSLKDTEKVKIRKQERCENDSLGNRGGSSSDKEINLPAFIEFFNRTLKEHHSVIPPIVKIGGQRKERLLARVKEYSKEALMKAVINAATAPFLNGASDKPFVASLDWIVRPNNFPKVLEGNYNHQVNNLNSQPYGTSSNNNGYRSREDIMEGAMRNAAQLIAEGRQPHEKLPIV